MEKVIPINKPDDPPGQVSTMGGGSLPITVMPESQSMAPSLKLGGEAPHRNKKGFAESPNLSPSGTGSPQSGDDEFVERRKSYQNSKKVRAVRASQHDDINKI